ncbi:hypothetical protein FQN54_003266 [Arachnomyces sp. PD_36]|nr:hypothetical protein FQN54_003266 [Arachnomyces sp. PD_36]
MSFLTTSARYSLRNATRGPGFLAAFHNSSLQMAPEAAPKPAGEQSQQSLRQKMNEKHHWREDEASSSESIVKADRGEMEGIQEVEMEEKKYKEKKKKQQTTEKKSG